MKNKKPKILYFDIETTPILGYAWVMYEANILKTVKDWKLLSVAYKWENEKEIRCFSQKNLSEKQVVKKLHSLFNEADVIIGHNSDSFDIKKSNAKFVQFKLKPPSLYKSVDTLKIARNKFKFTSNKLNDLAEFLGIGQKEKTGGFDLWIQCMAGNKSAWNVMEKYNKKDVVLLAGVYKILRSWMPNHPNLAAMEDKKLACPVCASVNVQKRGTAVSRTVRKQRLNCQKCGHWYLGETVKNEDES
ncbi:MAG: ribonuclease H-like domain-containing protein [Magnetococcus sp. WYHC-3]